MGFWEFAVRRYLDAERRVRLPVGDPSSSPAIAVSVRRVTFNSASVHVDIKRLIADSTVPTDGTVRRFPFAVISSWTRRASSGSVSRRSRPRASSRCRIPVSVLGCTCSVRARSPAESPGNVPRIRSTRRCGPVTPNLACMPRDARSRPWLMAHMSRMKSSTGPSGRSLGVSVLGLEGRP